MSISQPLSTAPTHHCVQGFRRAVYVATAVVCLVLGGIGVVLPGLPTTPFLLLASYLLARSWPRMNQLLLRSRVLGPILRDWHHHGAVTRRVKWTAITMVIAAMGLVVFFANLPGLAVLGVLSVAAVGLAVIHRLPTRE